MFSVEFVLTKMHDGILLLIGAIDIPDRSKTPRSAFRPQCELPAATAAIPASRLACGQPAKGANIAASSGVIRGILCVLEPQMPKIIISYRRSDSQAIAGRIFDRLSARYGEGAVFMDIDSIPFGVDFRQHISEVLLQCDALIALVGPHWLGRRDDGSSRIADSDDPVRLELEGAMERDVPIIPVLIDGARMPTDGELPPSLRVFSFFNAAPVDSGRDFRPHMDRLIKAVDSLVAPGETTAGSAPEALVAYVIEFDAIF